MNLKNTGVSHHFLSSALFRAVVPATLTLVTSIRFQNNLGILAPVTDRTIMLYFDLLGFFIHAKRLPRHPIKMCCRL